jgi:TolB-like protein/class 3 adenylate cyclase
MKNPSESQIRKLAAIMFTDIAGYTAIMQKDEEVAIRLRTRHREVFENNHKRFTGEIIQYYGDGTLSVFNSAIEAVKCAIEIQKALTSVEPMVPLRIGIHLGDIVYTGTEVIGDSVNISARVQSMGIPGSILISNKLNDELKNHQSIETVSLGKFEFKNVQHPMEVFAVSNKGIVVPDRSELKGKTKPHLKSIAVLPLVNMSASQENEYFSDGMTEEIINALSKIQGLNVTSRTSSFYFKNKEVPVKQIGKELNVSTILEGSVRLSGNKMRITTQLINVDEDVHFWSETFDRSLEDIFAVQDEVSLLIADKLREHVGHFEIEDHLVESPDISVDVYKKYLKSRYHILKMSKSEIEKGISILQEVISEQPHYPWAYLGLHLAFTLLGTLGFIPSVEAYAKGKSYLDKAIELDETIPECQLQLSWIAFLEDWDFDAAYKHLNNLRKIRPMVDYYQCTSTFLSAEGKLKAAMHYIDIATQMDPFSEINYHLKALLYHMEEKYDEAIHYYEKSLELRQDSQVSLLELGQSYILSGNAEKALELFSELDYPPDDPLIIGGLTIANAALGKTDEAREGMKKLELLMQTETAERAWFLLIYAHMIMGNHGKALEYLQNGVTRHFPMMLYLMRDPVLKPIRTTPQYKEIYNKVYAKSSEFQGGGANK